MRQLIFTPFAELQLDEILSWTFEEFGPQQADKYENELINRCLAIAEGIAATQNCSVILPSGAASSLHFGRAGQHIIVFMETSDAIVIVSLLHSKSNLAAQIETLSRKMDQ